MLSFFFPILPEQVVSDLRTDQVHVYSICWALIHGKVNDDLAYVEVGPIVHSTWLILGQNSALLCVSERATSEAGNSSSLLFNSF